jgi:alkanesulfonate monooxygenase
MSVIARRTRTEAVRAAHDLVAPFGQDAPERAVEGSFIQGSDSTSMRDLYRRAEQGWLAPTLWAGAVRTHGPAAVALVGSAEEVAGAILEYRRAGVSQFILSGWPKVESMEFFGTQVLPIVRRLERGEGAGVPA